jgi:hypothetical protein
MSSNKIPKPIFVLPKGFKGASSPQLPLPTPPPKPSPKPILKQNAPKIEPKVNIRIPVKETPPVIAPPVAPAKPVKPPPTIEQLEAGVKWWEKRLNDLRIYEDILDDETTAKKHGVKNLVSFMSKFNDVEYTSYEAEDTLKKWQKKLEQVKSQKERAI